MIFKFFKYVIRCVPKIAKIDVKIVEKVQLTLKIHFELPRGIFN